MPTCVAVEPANALAARGAGGEAGLEIVTVTVFAATPPAKSRVVTMAVY